MAYQEDRISDNIAATVKHNIKITIPMVRGLFVISRDVTIIIINEVIILRSIIQVWGLGPLWKLQRL